ncbi:Rdx family-domain-containing protein [Phialemonium atrogriseum]|uniref:Rdx family-domain-containing protein n=1 Tax=Phialemonium atrogriseum TaxID=1093897 RepID=A0AAJ0FMT7_9PEZI|nr:Rdx family-domain-containing protein [Phialemonium atrogriseum]KAK1768598.1 Rdx family-domain-containing protein [Phialemonium atrogriseum]
MVTMEGNSQPVDDTSPFPLPRVTIKFCTQCKWMLRAAYFAQELLSTFSTSLGEVALQPATGGVFVVEITHLAPATTQQSSRVLWDRKTDGGFPETKELKRRVRDAIDPTRDLGHVDRDYHHRAPPPPPSSSSTTTSNNPAAAAAAAAAGAGAMSPDQTTTATTTSPPAPATDPAFAARTTGVKPLMPPPPARLQAAAEARLDEAARRRAAREAGAEEEGAARRGGEKEKGDGGGGRAGCEDCQ